MNTLWEVSTSSRHTEHVPAVVTARRWRVEDSDLGRTVTPTSDSTSDRSLVRRAESVNCAISRNPI